MKLYFRNSQGKLRLIAEPINEKEAFAKIKLFLTEHDYTSYYTRSWIDKDTRRKIYDVGSWSEFFELAMTKETEVVNGE